MNKILTKEDYEIIESLVKTSLSIETLYKRLCTLERGGMIDSLEYKKTIDYLTIALGVESKIYEENDFSITQCREILDFLIKEHLSSKTLGDFESIVKQDFHDGHLKRIINMLNFKIKSSPNDMFNLDLTDEYQIQLVEDINRNIYLSNILHNYLLIDLVNTMLLLIDEEIKKRPAVKNHLINIKYYLSFVNRMNEEDLVNNNFMPKKKVCDNARLFSYVTGMSSEVYIKIKNEMLGKIVIKQIYKMLKINNKEELIIRSIVLRSLFMLLDDKSLCDIIDIYEGLIKGKNYLENDKNAFSEELIYDCFINAHSDKDKQIILKLY